MKQVVQGIFVVAVILCLAVPVFADGSFFADFWSWLKSFVPTGAQTVDPDGDGIDFLDNCPDVYNPGQEDVDQDNIGDVCDFVYSVSPSLLAQGSSAVLRILGNNLSNASISFSSDISVLNQSVVSDNALDVVVSVGVFADVGHYSVVGDVLGIDVVEGPLDLLNVSYSPAIVAAGPVNLSVNISVSENVNPAQISFTTATLSLFNNLTNENFTLNLESSSLDGNTFVLNFEPYTFGSGNFELDLQLSYNFVESFSPSVQIDETVALPPIFIPNFPGVCIFIVPFSFFGPPYCCPPVGVPGCGDDTRPHAVFDPGFGTVLATPYCPFGVLCTISNPPFVVGNTVSVCDAGYTGVPGAACSTSPTSACVAPFTAGQCMPAKYICAAGGAYPGITVGVFPVSPWLLGSMTCSAPPTNLCGDAVVQFPEACDDGNNVDCDASGCNADCTFSECGDIVICAPEECDPPGIRIPQQCGGLTCQIDCTCPPLPPTGNGGGGVKTEQGCAPFCEFDSSVLWKIVSIDANSNVMPAIPVEMNSFRACLQQTGQAKLSRPQMGVMTFAVHKEDSVYSLGQLPIINERRDPEDAKYFYDKQKEWLQKIAGNNAVSIDQSPVLFCPAPSNDHLNAYLRSVCNVNSKARIFINYGWVHSTKSKDDIIDVQRLTYYVNDVETTVDIDCDVAGEDCNRKLELELPSPASDVNTNIFVADVLGVKKTFEGKKPDCVSCPPAEFRGNLYANPCCSGKVPSACCDVNNKFLQGKVISAPSSRCYRMSTIIDGPQKNVCLVDMATCDITYPNYLTGSNIYRQFGWVPNVECTSSFVDPFTDALTGTNYGAAVSACPAVEPCAYPSRFVRGFDVGECHSFVWECGKTGVWDVVREGVGPSVEVCDRLDNNCNTLIDEVLYCKCNFVGETKPCKIGGTAKAKCVDAIGALVYDNTPCYEEWYGPQEQPKPEVLVAAPSPGEFAILGQNYGVPCGEIANKVFSYCDIFNKQTDGPLYVRVKEYGGVIGSSLSGAATVELPDYVKLASYELGNCDGGDVEIALNVPPLKDFVAVFKRGEESVLLPSGLGVAPGLAGYDAQELFDKATIPIVSYASVKEGVVLSPVASRLSALGITAEFSGGIKGVKVSLESADVKIRDRALAVIGQPLKFVFVEPKPMGVTIRSQLVLRDNLDPDSLGFYLYRDNKWNYVGGKIENDFFVVSLDDVMPLLEDNSLTFMIAGSVCDGCVKPYLFNVRDVDSPLLVVLVHGLFSSPSQSWSALVKEFEDEDVNVDVAVFGYAGSPVPDAVRALSDELRKKDYGKIVFITHSLGGLVVREFLHQEELREDSLIPKVEAFIMTATPNQGTPLTSSVKKVFEMTAWLLGRVDSAPIMGAHPETLDLLTKGLQYSVPPSVKVFSLAGTKDQLQSGLLFDLPAPNDGVITVESAKRLNGVVLEDSCVNELEQPVGHLMMNSGPEQRYTLLYFLRRLSSEFNERAPPQMYAALKIDNCQSGVLEVYGKLLDSNALPPPEGCEMCGNGVCELGENCPSDCVSPERQVAFGGYPVARVLEVLLAVNLLLTVLYHVKTWKFQKWLRYCIYALAVLALPLFVAGYIFGVLSFIPVLVYVLILLMIFIDVLIRTNSGFYRWH